MFDLDGYNFDSRLAAPGEAYADERMKLMRNPKKFFGFEEFKIDNSRVNDKGMFSHTLRAQRACVHLRYHFPKTSGFTVKQRQDRARGVVVVMVSFDYNLISKGC